MNEEAFRALRYAFFPKETKEDFEREAKDVFRRFEAGRR